MKDKLDDMNKDYYRGFPISEEEYKTIEKWKTKHEQEVHNLYTTQDRLRAGGCIGGNYIYEFIPTSLGVIGTIKCNCDENFTFRDL